MEIDPWGAILAVLFDDESSDYILRVLQRAGVPTAFDLTPDEAYSHKTRKRAYQRRLDLIPADASRHRITQNVAHEIAKAEGGPERLNAALGRIGWTFQNDELMPLPSDGKEVFSQTPKAKLLAEIEDIIGNMPPRATIRHDTQENMNWFGRASAAIETWNPSKSALAREYVDLFFSQVHAREAGFGLTKLLTLLNQARAELRLETTSVQRYPVSMRRKVFIGHGRSLVWLQLKTFLTDRLHLTCDEFNAEAVAGITTTARLQALLDDAVFAFLVMTAEDTHADSSTHARENVIHEAGLFQGRLGFERAIILLEEGCAQFSNIHGLSYIGFPKGNLESAFEKIRRVLEREQVL